MSHPQEPGLSRLKERLRQLEEEFERQMRARGFDPAQDEHLALTAPLAKLYNEREQLRAELQTLGDNDAEPTG
jgi:hypothetical protein